jgi:hypothetical protein
MERAEGNAWMWDWAWLVVFGVASSVWCVAAAGELGATFDEPLYVAKGLEHWRTGSHAGLMKLGTMPLPVDLDTLPLYVWESWRGAPFDVANDLEWILPWARAGTLVFWWLLLVYARLAGRMLAGPWGGRLAVALIACEPSFLAHAALATTDIAASACLLALAYHFRTGRDCGWLGRVGVPALWFGAAVLAKASGLVFGPLCLIVIELEYRLARAAGGENTGVGARLRRPFGILLGNPFRRDLIQMVAVGMALVFVYCGCDWRSQPAFVQWAHKLPEGDTRERMVWLAENLRIFSNAGEGLVRQIKHNMHGHGTYLLGQSNHRAIWYYFPLVLTIKLTLGLLILPAIIFVTRPRALVNWACLAALALLAFSLTCRVQIGIRLILPLVVVAIVGIAAGMVRAWETMPSGWGRRVLAGSATVCIAWAGAAAVIVWPNGLCYINEAWGGTGEGYRCLSDSNYDWGQGLRELARWQRTHGVDSLDIWYFGSDPLLKKLPMREVPLHVPSLEGPSDVRSRVKGRYLAASTTLLYGNTTNTPEHGQAAAFLQHYEPVARTTTFLIFDLSGPKSR